MSKKILNSSSVILLLILLSWQNGFSFSMVSVPLSAVKNEMTNPAYLKASVFVKMSPAQFAAATGKKLNLFQKIYFKVIKRQVKRDLKKNPDLLMSDYFDKKEGKFKFDLLWFVIAAFIGPLGLLLAYTSKDRKGGPKKKDRINSAWLGFAFFVIWFGFIFVF